MGDDSVTYSFFGSASEVVEQHKWATAQLPILFSARLHLVKWWRHGEARRGSAVGVWSSKSWRCGGRGGFSVYWADGPAALGLPRAGFRATERVVEARRDAARHGEAQLWACGAAKVGGVAVAEGCRFMGSMARRRWACLVQVSGLPRRAAFVFCYGRGRAT